MTPASFHLLTSRPGVVSGKASHQSFGSCGGKTAFLLLSFKASSNMLGTNICQMCDLQHLFQCVALLLSLLIFILA